MTDTPNELAGESDTLSVEEQAFFNSGGEAAPVAETPPAATASDEATTDLDAVDDDAAGDGSERDEQGRFKPKKKGNETVPHSVFHAEREEHKRTKQEVQEIKQQAAILNDRWNTMLQAMQAQQPPPQTVEQADPEPDPNVDIFAHQQWMARARARDAQRLAGLEHRLAEEANQRATAEKTAALEKAVWGHWERSAQDFAKEAPDFGKAAEYLSKARDGQLASLSTVQPQFADKKARDRQIETELFGIIIGAHQRGISPARAVYDLAKGYGYAGPAPAPAPADSPTDRIAALANAQDRSKTVAQAPGKSGGDELTPEQLLSMSDGEFSAWSAANAHKFRQMLGG